MSKKFAWSKSWKRNPIKVFFREISALLFWEDFSQYIKIIPEGVFFEWKNFLRSNFTQIKNLTKFTKKILPGFA